MYLEPINTSSTVVPLHRPPITLRTTDLRRALFAALLARPHAASLDDLVEELEVREHLDVVGHLRVSPRQRIADLLWWEIERGHVEHVAAGRYRLIESSLSPSVRWRCEHWRELIDRRAERRGDSEVSTSSGPPPLTPHPHRAAAPPPRRQPHAGETWSAARGQTLTDTSKHQRR